MNTRNMLTGFFLVLAVLTEGAIALSSTKWNNAADGLARGPAGLRIEGKGSEVSLEEDDSALTFKVPLAPIETGISLRDVHLRQMLEADKYPAATLRISRSQLTFPREREPVERTAEGGLTLHGQSRTVKVHYRAELGAGGVTMVRVSLQLGMRDLDINVPAYPATSL